MTKRLLLLMGARTYRAPDFLAAARRLGVALTVGSDQPQVVGEGLPGAALTLDFHDPAAAVSAIQSFHREWPLDAVVSVDDAATVVAARASATLGLAGNPEEATVAARNKQVFREITRAMGLPTPWFRPFSLDDDPEAAAGRVEYPCVLKPLFLSASRGVIRANDRAGFVRAFRRIGKLLARPEIQAEGGSLARVVMAEGFIPGPEVTLEGIVEQGRFALLAFFDKPEPMDGPFFEETLYVTPSRHPPAWQERTVELARRVVAALGLRTGPVHAEFRLNGGEPVPLEVAPRSIGGHCSRILRFGTGISLEELILRQALGLTEGSREREAGAAGVMMIPIPEAGILEAVEGLEKARAVAGIEDVEITIPLGQPVVPPPEGDRYLGFLFARGSGPEAVEAALRQAHRCLRFRLAEGGGKG